MTLHGCDPGGGRGGPVRSIGMANFDAVDLKKQKSVSIVGMAAGAVALPVNAYSSFRLLLRPFRTPNPLL